VRQADLRCGRERERERERETKRERERDSEREKDREIDREGEIKRVTSGLAKSHSEVDGCCGGIDSREVAFSSGRLLWGN
jgi:hypothetical protein